MNVSIYRRRVWPSSGRALTPAAVSWSLDRHTSAGVLHIQKPAPIVGPANGGKEQKPDGRRERGRLRQRAMIDVARDLFIQEGYRGVTLEAIIARAGGSRETIYRVFGGKAGLFRAIIAQASAELAEATVEPVSTALEPNVALTWLGVELAKIWKSSEGAAINRVVVAEGADNPELVEAWYLGGPAPTLKVLDDYLATQVAAGRLKPMQTRLVARQFLSLLMCELAFPLVSGSADPKDPPARVENCVNLILAAYQITD